MNDMIEETMKDTQIFPCCGVQVGGYSTSHPFKCFGKDLIGHPVHIDLLMVPVITSLWKWGIRTKFCCQGDEDMKNAYICLENGVVSEAARDRALKLIKEHLRSPDSIEIMNKGWVTECWRFGWGERVEV